MSGSAMDTEERLREARAVLADVVHHDPEAVGAACATVVALSEDAIEREEARQLQRLVAGPPPADGRREAGA